MKNYTITVNGSVYDVVVEEGATSGAPAAAAPAAPRAVPKAAPAAAAAASAAAAGGAAGRRGYCRADNPEGGKKNVTGSIRNGGN